jgi:hypothetical protein
MIPIVFISSTVEDLKPYRAAAQQAANRARFHPCMQDYFVASGGNPPLRKCLEEVSKADVLVVIVAHRYGWVPPDQPPLDAKSITWLECEQADRNGKEVLAFLVDKNFDWPFELKEAYRTMAATEAGNATPELVAEVQRNVAKLREFKQWLGTKGISVAFTNPDSLRAEVEAALHDWRDRRPEFADRGHSTPLSRDDPRKYLESLREQTAWIDIRGLEVGTGKAYRFPTEDLYIPLTTKSQREKPRKGSTAQALARKTRSGTSVSKGVDLQDALTYWRLVIVGDPGAGKTTFLQHIALALSGTLLEPESATLGPNINRTSDHQDDASMTFRGRLAAALRKASRGNRKVAGTTEDGHGLRFPILIRVSELVEHIRNCSLRPGHRGPTTKESPQWLVDFLNTQNMELNWGLSETFFRDKLQGGSSILLLDGLDEASTRIERELIARLFENATHAYNLCQFVVTTRPHSYVGRAMLADFQVAQIEPLGTDAIDKFLQHWCRALFPQSPDLAERHLAELSKALRSRPQIHDMAGNPLMLTALAVLHWNERRLPEQRADLYESIVTWLARSRQKRPGRQPAERCLTLLQQLAFAMQDHHMGRQVQVSKRWAAEILLPKFLSGPKGERLEKAQEFIDQEEADSGIIVSRASEIRFSHLMFQEYLAARHIAGQADSAQHELLLTGNKIYKQEWREVAVLFGGILLVKQGAGKVDGLITATLNHLGTQPSMGDLLRCSALLGAIVKDLSPLGYEPADRRFSLVEMMEAVLKTLTPREEKVIKMLFGQDDGLEHTVAEVGQCFAVSPRTIKSIEAKGLRKLTHPSRSRRWAKLLSNSDQAQVPDPGQAL